MGVIDIARVISLVQAAEAEALEEVGDFVAEDARSRAPIRKVFKEAKGFKRKFRALTPAERHLAIKRALAYQGYTDFERRRSVAHIAHYARAEIRRPSSANSLSRSRTLRNLGIQRGSVFTPRVDAQRHGRGYTSAMLNPRLTSRGRYEISSGRAIHEAVSPAGTVTHIQVGGALKASIGSEGVEVTDTGATIKVAARIRYAKYVEFPTTHNASQPFLLPALHDSRPRLRRELANSLRKRLGG